MGIDPSLAAMSSAAVQRAGVERGDPLLLAKLVTVQREITASKRVGAPSLAPDPAATDEAVAVDRTRLAAGEGAVGELPAREDGAAMEHERQRRLARWQVER